MSSKKPDKPLVIPENTGDFSHLNPVEAKILQICSIEQINPSLRDWEILIRIDKTHPDANQDLITLCVFPSLGIAQCNYDEIASTVRLSPLEDSGEDEFSEEHIAIMKKYEHCARKISAIISSPSISERNSTKVRSQTRRNIYIVLGAVVLLAVAAERVYSCENTGKSHQQTVPHESDKSNK